MYEINLIFNCNYCIITKDKNKKEKENIVEEIKPDETETLIENIVELNLDLRLNLEDLYLIKEVEKLFDRLIELLKLVNVEENYTENTPLINRMAVSYLPKFVNNYLALNSDKKIENREEFLKGIKILDNTISKSYDNLSKKNTQEFNKQVGFIKSFFDGDFNGEMK